MRAIWISLLFATGIAAAAPLAAPANQAGEARTVLTVVNTLLDGWREADAAKAGSVLHADFREVTYHLDDGAWNFSPVTRERLLGVLPKIKPGDWDDRLLDPVVHVDGPIAVVWSHYRFRTPYTENGVFHDAAHCGVETFQLYKFEAGWRIVNFADTHAECR